MFFIMFFQIIEKLILCHMLFKAVPKPRILTPKRYMTSIPASVIMGAHQSNINKLLHN